MSDSNNHKNTIAAIILSGGRGTRLNGLDKGLQSHNNKPLIEWVINAIKPQVQEIIISINRNKYLYEKFNLTTVLDETFDSNDHNADYNGPIAGILSGVNALNKNLFDYYLIASCDSPNLNNDYIERLHQKILNGTYDVAIVNDGYRNQNLHCLIRKNAIKSLSDYFFNNGRSMYGWLKEASVVEVDFSDQANCFTNINTQDDLISLINKE